MLDEKTKNKIREICDGCKLLNYAYSWLDKPEDPEYASMIMYGTFSLYKPGEEKSELSCIAVKELVGEIPFEMPDYCKTGRCLVLDTINEDSKNEEPKKDSE